MLKGWNDSERERVQQGPLGGRPPPSVGHQERGCLGGADRNCPGEQLGAFKPPPGLLWEMCPVSEGLDRDAVGLSLEPHPKMEAPLASWLCASLGAAPWDAGAALRGISNQTSVAKLISRFTVSFDLVFL